MEQANPSKHLSLREIWDGIKVAIKYSKDQKADFRILIFFTLSLALVEAFTPYVWGIFIDTLTNIGEPPVSKSLINNPFIAMSIWAIILLSSSLLGWSKSLKQRKIEENVRITYRLKANYKLLQLPLSFHTHHKLGETGDKIMRGSNGVFDVLTQIILERLPSAFSSILMIVILFSINSLFGLIALIGFSLAAISSYLNLKQGALMQRKTQEFYKKMWGRMADIMSNFRTIKDFATEDYENTLISKNFKEEVFPYWFNYFKTQKINALIQNMIAIVTRVTVLVLSIHLMFSGDLTLGKLITINGLINFGPILNLINIRNQLQNNIISIEEAEKLLSIPPEIYEPKGAKKFERLTGAIEFKNVSFKYDGSAQTLDDVSFKIEPGETVAIVGESGTGKSTLIDLLMGYYFPTSGEILIDGIDTKSISLTKLRQNIGVVPQDIALFNDTVFNNIKYGSFDATEKEVVQAAMRAHCSDFIEKFPNKWEQLVGERGMKLSMGQKQRIAIARAFLRNPSVLILDEPTSALDAHSEEIITSSIESLLEGRTTIIVAHRLSTVRKATKILVFKESKLIEEGSHSALIKKKGEYERLYKLQHKSV